MVAAVRNVDHPSSKELLLLPAGNSSRLILVKIDSEALPDPKTAIESLTSMHGITALDLVIANAGISTEYPTVAEADPQVVMKHFSVNVLGPLMLFQAVRPLMLEAKHPIFMAMSSAAGSIGGIELAPVPNAAYGTSKAALNYLTRKIHFENDSICSICMHPGWVQTDMGISAAVKFGIPGGLAEVSVEDSVKGVVSVVRTHASYLTFCAWADVLKD